MSKLIPIETLASKQSNTLLILGRKKNIGRKNLHCKCICGKEFYARATDIINEKVKSCGCLKISREDIIGQKYGNLTVIKRLPDDIYKYMVECQCDCGNIVKLRYSTLTSGNTKSCGCLSKEIHRKLRIRFVDLSGQKFGRLTVVKESNRNRKRSIWECRCDCGKIVIVPSNYLTTGDTQSCGCLAKDKLRCRSKYSNLDISEAIRQQLLARYKHRASHRQLAMSLSGEDLIYLTSKPCGYCGCWPNQKFKIRGHKQTILINGIDRVDNTLGYSRRNCIPCCMSCNRMKNATKVEEFLSQIKKITRYTRDTIS